MGLTAGKGRARSTESRKGDSRLGVGRPLPLGTWHFVVGGASRAAVDCGILFPKQHPALPIAL
jgi:hypothetical protein